MNDNDSHCFPRSPMTTTVFFWIAGVWKISPAFSCSTKSLLFPYSIK